MSAKVRALGVVDLMIAAVEDKELPELDFEPEHAFATQNVGRTVTFTAPSGERVQGVVIGYSEKYANVIARAFVPVVLIGMKAEVVLGNTPAEMFPPSVLAQLTKDLGRASMLDRDDSEFVHFLAEPAFEDEVVIPQSVEALELVEVSK
jgi:hypothetical protein